jgi:hypothetical protein
MKAIVRRLAQLEDRFISVTHINLACHSRGGTKLRYQRRQYPRGQRTLPQPCRAVLSAKTASEMDNTALLT